MSSATQRLMAGNVLRDGTVLESRAKTGKGGNSNAQNIVGEQNMGIGLGLPMYFHFWEGQIGRAPPQRESRTLDL